MVFETLNTLPSGIYMCQRREGFLLVEIGANWKKCDVGDSWGNIAM